MSATIDVRARTRPRPRLLGRVTRCMGVSIVTTIISVATIIVATAVFGVVAWFANVIATGIATVPSYSLNRRWTWGRRDPSDPWREILPFWLLAFCGLALSTITVGLADSWASRLHLTPPTHTAAILAGHLGGFGVLWVAQFVLLDRVLFGVRPAVRTDAAPLEAPRCEHPGAGPRWWARRPVAAFSKSDVSVELGTERDSRRVSVADLGRRG